MDTPDPNDKIGNEIDLKYGYQYSKNLSFETRQLR